MQEILTSLKEVYARCIGLEERLQSDVSRAQETENQQKKTGEELTKLRADLKEREAKIIIIENLQQHRADSDLRMGQAQATIDDFHARTVNFTKYEEAEKKELQARKEALDKREKATNDKETNLENIILEKVRRILKK